MTEVVVWSGWVGGLAVGLYLLLQLVLTGKLLGVSTGYGNLCSYLTRLPFFHRGTFAHPANWRLWFILGLPLGGLVAALTSPGPIAASFSMGVLYDAILPQALWARGLVLGLGGVLIGYGARLAGGCTSGHAISGSALLNPPSWLAAVGFFVGGTVTVQVLFRLFG